MPTQRRRVVIVLAVALVTALAEADQARAAGAVNIDSCQTLSIPNTTYKVTGNLTGDSHCLLVAANRITIDLQGHSITGSNVADSIGIDDPEGHDLVIVKNGFVTQYDAGVRLNGPRASVIAVTATNNRTAGILVQGPQSLVKSSTASGGVAGILAVGDRAQIQQSTASHNSKQGIVAGNNCLVTMNTATFNGLISTEVGQWGGIFVGEKCTVSYNTATDNGLVGIFARARSLVTRNTAMRTGANGVFDFAAVCPADVTFNDSTKGYPESYLLDVLDGPPCKTVGNE